MSGQDLTSELRRRAEETAEAIRDAASVRVAEIEAEARRQVAQIRTQSLREAEAALRAGARSNIAAEKQSALSTILQSRNRLVDRVVAKATDLLSEFSWTQTFATSVAREVSDCRKFLGSGGGTVRCSPGVTAAAREALRGDDHLTVEEDETIQAGFVIESRDGSLSIDHRLETRLARNRARLATHVVRTLGGD